MFLGVVKAVDEYQKYKKDGLKYYTKGAYWFYKKTTEDAKFWSAP